MKQDELIKRVLAGEPLIVVEYRSFKIDAIRYRDKQTQQTVARNIVKHGIEMGDAQVSVTEWLPDGTDLKTVNPAFAKGEKCVLKLRGMEPQQGFYNASGELLKLDSK